MPLTPLGARVHQFPVPRPGSASLTCPVASSAAPTPNGSSFQCPSALAGVAPGTGLRGEWQVSLRRPKMLRAVRARRGCGIAQLSSPRARSLQGRATNTPLTGSLLTPQLQWVAGLSDLGAETRAWRPWGWHSRLQTTRAPPMVSAWFICGSGSTRGRAREALVLGVLPGSVRGAHSEPFLGFWP